MADQEKPKRTLTLRGPEMSAIDRTRSQPAWPKPVRMRTQEELRPLALRIAESAVIMQRFRAASGSEDRDRAAAVMDEVTKYAQHLDSTVTGPEGTRLALILMQMIAGKPSE